MELPANMQWLKMTKGHKFKDNEQVDSSHNIGTMANDELHHPRMMKWLWNYSLDRMARGRSEVCIKRKKASKYIWPTIENGTNKSKYWEKHKRNGMNAE